MQTFFKEHKKVAIALLSGIFLILVLVIIIFITSQENDGVEGTDSRAFEASQKEDQKAIEASPTLQIINSLPITSQDPPYTIAYQLDRDETGNYTVKLILNAFSASARDAMLSRLLSESFNGHDPLQYDLVLENYFDPFSSFSLTDLAEGKLPTNFTKGALTKIDGSDYSVQIFKHTLYDGSTNTYRAVYQNGEPKTLPKLIFTYAELSFLEPSQVKSLNSIK